MIEQDRIRKRFAVVSSQLDERARRLLAATEARAAGYGGIAAVSQATGVAPSTDRARLAGLGGGGPAGAGPGAAARRRPQASGGQRSDAAGGSAEAGGARCAWRSDVAVALDL